MTIRYLKKNSKNSKKNNSQSHGFALVVTLILSSVMLTIVTIASKDIIDEMRNSSRLDNSLIAYYAAEAGVEDALLQYRYNHMAEISPEECREIETHNIANSEYCAPNTFGKTHYYKLRMTNKTTEEKDIKIRKDDTYEISIPESNSVNTFNINWTNGNSNIRVEAVSYLSDGTIIDKKFSDSGETSMILNTNGLGNKLIRIKPWLPTDSPDAYIILRLPTDTNSGTTTIDSTGYYANVARKIIAKIDSSTGSIVSIFDYTIYSDTALLK